MTNPPLNPLPPSPKGFGEARRRTGSDLEDPLPGRGGPEAGVGPTNGHCGACCTRIENLGVRIGAATILERVDLHLHCGQLTALIGPNGAGKTTLLRAMLGELPHSGELRFLPVRKASRDTIPRIGYVPQKLEVDALSPVSVSDLFAAATSRWPAWLRGHHRASSKALSMLPVVGGENLAGKRLGQLSGGELQRVLLALALTPVPEILLLDEPVSGVDPTGIELFYQMVSRFRQDYDLSILLISHDLPAVARVADRMVFLNRTILCDGTPREVLSHPLVRQTFGFDLLGAPMVREPVPSDRYSPHHPAVPTEGKP